MTGGLGWELSSWACLSVWLGKVAGGVARKGHVASARKVPGKAPLPLPGAAPFVPIRLACQSSGSCLGLRPLVWEHHEGPTDLWRSRLPAWNFLQEAIKGQGGIPEPRIIFSISKGTVPVGAGQLCG